MAPALDRRSSLALVALLAATLLVYSPSFRHGFVSFDDPVYVSENPVVGRGLTLEGVRWAFGFHAGNWHPLTWLSHMLDVELFDLDAGKHHLVSALLHATNALLLFLALARMSACPWTSLAVAAFFALHPLRVESVAWASERKDVLAGTFWMATLLAWTRYAERPSLGRSLAVSACLALGLGAKPMLVTLPFVLLLLDYWPLGRWSAGGGSRARESEPAPPPALPSPAPTHPGKAREETRGAGAGYRLFVEKLPLFALVLAAAAVTFVVQRGGGAVGSLQSLSLAERAANAAVAAVAYLRQTFWPVDLACFVPHPAVVADDLVRELLVPALLAALGLALFTVLVLRRARRSPYLFTGWFWYLGTLVPVIGLVQVGAQAHADRYTYLPTIGIAILVCFGLRDMVVTRPRLRIPVVGGVVLALVALATLAWRQVGTWRDSRALFEHALAVDDRNYIAHTFLGKADRRAGRAEAARDHLEQALAINPRHVDAMYELGAAYRDLGDLVEARRAFKRTLRNDPADAAAHNDLGVVLLELDETEEAREHFERALALEPDSFEALLNLAQIWVDSAPERARELLEHARELRPSDPELQRLLRQARRSQPEAGE